MGFGTNKRGLTQSDLERIAIIAQRGDLRFAEADALAEQATKEALAEIFGGSQPAPPRTQRPARFEGETWAVGIVEAMWNEADRIVAGERIAEVGVNEWWQELTTAFSASVRNVVACLGTLPFVPSTGALRADSGEPGETGDSPAETWRQFFSCIPAGNDVEFIAEQSLELACLIGGSLEVLVNPRRFSTDERVSVPKERVISNPDDDRTQWQFVEGLEWKIARRD